MKIRNLFILSLVIAIFAVAAVPMANPNALNARFVRWVDRSNVIHIFTFNDEGRPFQPFAIVTKGQWVLFGFEWGGEPVEVLQAYVDSEDHDIRVSIDGGAPISVKDGYQPAFLAIPGNGPRWSWDHDGDGLGDGNGNGIGDWDGPYLFFRYLHTGLDVGIHTFEFTVEDPGSSATDMITVEVLADS